MKQVKILTIEINDKEMSLTNKLQEIAKYIDRGYLTGLGWDIVFETIKPKMPKNLIDANCEWCNSKIKKCVELLCNYGCYHYICKRCKRTEGFK